MKRPPEPTRSRGPSTTPTLARQAPQVYVAGALQLTDGQAYALAVQQVRRAFPRATLIFGGREFGDHADWRVPWPGMLQRLDALVVVTARDGVAGAGVLREAADMLARGRPVWWTDSGPLRSVGTDGAHVHMRDAFDWRSCVRFCDCPGGSLAPDMALLIVEPVRPDVVRPRVLAVIPAWVRPMNVGYARAHLRWLHVDTVGEVRTDPPRRPIRCAWDAVILADGEHAPRDGEVRLLPDAQRLPGYASVFAALRAGGTVLHLSGSGVISRVVVGGD